jgi:hypothetical protein
VGQETDTAIAQAEHVPGTARAVIVELAHHFAFAEMIAAAIRTKLRDLLEEIGELTGW